MLCIGTSSKRETRYFYIDVNIIFGYPLASGTFMNCAGTDYSEQIEQMTCALYMEGYYQVTKHALDLDPDLPLAH